MQPTMVTLIGSNLAPMSINKINIIIKLKNNVKKDFTPLCPPTIVINNKRIISNINDTLMAL